MATNATEPPTLLLTAPDPDPQRQEPIQPETSADFTLILDRHRASAPTQPHNPPSANTPPVPENSNTQVAQARNVIRNNVGRIAEHLGVTLVGPNNEDIQSFEHLKQAYAEDFQSVSRRYEIPQSYLERAIEFEAFQANTMTDREATAADIVRRGATAAADVFINRIFFPIATFGVSLTQETIPISDFVFKPGGFSVGAGNVKALPNLTQGIISRIQDEALREELQADFDRNGEITGQGYVSSWDLRTALGPSGEPGFIPKTLEVMGVLYQGYHSMIQQLNAIESPNLRQLIAPGASNRGDRFAHTIYRQGPLYLPTRAYQAELAQQGYLKVEHVDGYWGAITQSAAQRASEDGVAIEPEIKIPDYMIGPYSQVSNTSFIPSAYMGQMTTSDTR